MGFLSFANELSFKKPANTLDELRAGDKALIVGLAQDFPYRDRFLELGFTVGTDLTLIRKALFGDPIEIRIRGTRYALRKSDARHIRIQKDN